MVVSSVQFVFVFLPLALAVYYLVPRAAKNAVLALFSLLFCVWGGVRYAALMTGFAAVNFVFGLLLNRAPDSAKKPMMAAAVALDLIPLAFFKYAGFFAAGVNVLLPGALPVLRLALPLGISFYTFQGISYCVDVARGKYPPTRNPLRFYLFLCFFAHAGSGPIVRWDQQAGALDPANRVLSAPRFCCGAKRFIYGLAKKTILADQLALLYNSVTSVSAAELPGCILFVGYLAFTLQLYFDFSGYSDMALGLGELFGLPLPENFNYPYLARSIGEYWRRWHMTLSGWFRDYVYIPLGGSRRGLARTCLNLLVVFTLTGLWHGAAWQYVVFGLYQGLLLCGERLCWGKPLQKAPAWCGHLYTVVTLYIGLVVFAAPGLNAGLLALRGIFTWQTGAPGYTLQAFLPPKLLLLLLAGILLCGPLQALLPRLRAQLHSREVPRLPEMIFLLVLLFFSVMRLTAGNYSAFIYAQF